jgi:hypothetical protein
VTNAGRVSSFDAEGAGNPTVMKWHKRIRFDRDGVSVAADVNAAVSVNRGEADETNVVRSVSHVHVVQDSRRPRERPDRAGESEDDRKEHT